MALGKFFATIRRRKHAPLTHLKPVVDINDRAGLKATVSKALTSVKKVWWRPKLRDPALANSPFLPNLPPEIRSEIYRHVFQSADDEPTLVPQCTPKKPPVWTWVTHSETSILHVCKQTYAEALPVLYRIAKFSWTLQSYRPEVIRAVLERLRPPLRNSICHIELMLVLRHDMDGWKKKIEQLKTSFAQLVKFLPGLKRADVQIYFIDLDDRFLKTQTDVEAAAAFIEKVITPLTAVEHLFITDPASNLVEIPPSEERRRRVLDEVRQGMSNQQ